MITENKKIILGTIATAPNEITWAYQIHEVTGLSLSVVSRNLMSLELTGLVCVGAPPNEESSRGPERKYYTLTPRGKNLTSR